MIDRYFSRGLARLDEIDALGLTRPELFDLWVTTRELERIADHADGIARAAARLEGGDGLDPATVDEVAALASDAREVVEDAVGPVVGDADVDAARAALTARDRVRRAVDALGTDRPTTAPADAALFPVLDRLRRTAEHGGNIAEQAMRAAIRNGDPGTTAPPGEGDDHRGRESRVP